MGIEVNDALILKLEKLARLRLSVEERSTLRGDLKSILKMVEKLDEVNTEGVEPLRHIIETDGELRTDQVGRQLSSDEAVSNAPAKKGPFFKVPKVIDRK